MRCQSQPHLVTRVRPLPVEDRRFVSCLSGWSPEHYVARRVHFFTRQQRQTRPTARVGGTESPLFFCAGELIFRRL